MVDNMVEYGTRGVCNARHAPCEHVDVEHRLRRNGAGCIDVTILSTCAYMFQYC